MARGLFITLEGGEGVGKSTLARGLVARLEARGRAVLQTREPGGTPGAEAIRALLVNGPVDRWGPAAEALLMSAARADHVARAIGPALEDGRDVVCDRFADSTMAYQGLAGGLGVEAAEALAQVATGGLAPDLTLVLDLDPAVGLSRAAARRAGEDRFEAKGIVFHTALRDAFRAIAAQAPQRCVLIDAGEPPEAVLAKAWAAVTARLP